MTSTSNILGLMRKFRNEGFPAEREIAWLRGGFHAVWRENPDFVDRNPAADDADEEEASGDVETDGDPAPLGGSSARVLRAKQLPESAFTSVSTIALCPRVSVYVRRRLDCTHS